MYVVYELSLDFLYIINHIGASIPIGSNTVTNIIIFIFHPFHMR